MRAFLQARYLAKFGIIIVIHRLQSWYLAKFGFIIVIHRLQSRYLAKFGFIIKPAREARLARRAHALRALGLLLADGTPTGGRGEDFLSRQPNFFYGNSCNSGTESRKMVSKVGN